MKNKSLCNALSLTFFLVFCCLPSIGQKKQKSPYGNATYTAQSLGAPMAHWLVAGPSMVSEAGAPDEETQSKFFKSIGVPSVEVNGKKGLKPIEAMGKTYEWTAYSAKDGNIDFDAQFQKKDYAVAYALAEIVSDAERKIILAFGSDDGIKVFLNGKVIHENWTPRGLQPDQDLVPTTLQKGSNQIVVAVQDMAGDWGFSARALDNAAITERMVQAVAKGNADDVTLLINGGADVNGKARNGLTALGAAKLYGRNDLTTLLKTKGASDETIPDGPTLTDGEYAWLKDKKAAGIAVLVAKDGNIIYKNGFGYADVAKGKLIEPTTKFRIGSITKQFIGAAVLRLQEEGKISVHDKLSKYIPDFPKGEEVTVHHLLTHTSGIHSYTNKNEFVGQVTKFISEEDLVSIIKKESYDFEPGERFLYNNSGYFLLGHIIRKVTGKPFGEYLKSAFFEPLGMKNTGVYENAAPPENEAYGYKKENGVYMNDINWDMSWAGAAGALYSTVEDLYRWNEGLFNGKVLKPSSLNDALTPVILNNGTTPSDGKYGYGWFINEYRGQEVIEHGGGLHGFSTRIARFPEENLTVVMLTNVLPTEVNLNPYSVGEFFIWNKMDDQKSFVASEVSEDVKPYVGRYSFGNGLFITITEQENKLFAQVTGQSKFPIFPAAPGEYFWRVVEARIKFMRNEKGEVTGAGFSQNGAQRVIQKVEDLVIVSIDASLLDYYVGKYDFGDSVMVTVSKENDKLYAQTQTSPRFEIKPLSDTEFTLQEMDAKLTFVREGQQKATKFIMDMAGQRKDVPRIE